MLVNSPQQALAPSLCAKCKGQILTMHRVSLNRKGNDQNKKDQRTLGGYTVKSLVLVHHKKTFLVPDILYHFL